MGSSPTGTDGFRKAVYMAVHEFNTASDQRGVARRGDFGRLISCYYNSRLPTPLFRLVEWVKSLFGRSNLQQARTILSDHVWKRLQDDDLPPIFQIQKPTDRKQVDQQLDLFLKGVSSLALLRQKADPASWSKESLPKGTAHQMRLNVQALAPQSASPSRPATPASASSSASSSSQTSRDFDGRGQYFLWDSEQRLWLPLPCNAANIQEMLAKQGADEASIQQAMLVGTQGSLNEISTGLAPEAPPKGFVPKNVTMDDQFGYTVYFAVEAGQVKVRVEGKCQICDFGKATGPAASVTAFYDPTDDAQHVELRATYL